MFRPIELSFVTMYLALGYVEECFYFKYQKNEAVTVQ